MCVSCKHLGAERNSSMTGCEWVNETCCEAVKHFVLMQRERCIITRSFIICHIGVNIETFPGCEMLWEYVFLIMHVYSYTESFIFDYLVCQNITSAVLCGKEALRGDLGIFNLSANGTRANGCGDCLLISTGVDLHMIHFSLGCACVRKGQWTGLKLFKWS